MKKFLLFLVITFPFALFSQISYTDYYGEEHSVEIISYSPIRSEFINLGVDGFFGGLYQFQYDGFVNVPLFGYGFHFNSIITNSFQVFADYQVNSEATMFEVGLNYTILPMTIERREKFSKSSNVSSRFVGPYIYNRNFGARAGYQSFNTIQESPLSTGSQYDIVNANYQNVYFGIGVFPRSNVIFKRDDGLYIQRSIERQLYFDLIFNVSNDVLTSELTNPNFKQRKVGMRVGHIISYGSKLPGKALGIKPYYGFEFSLLPAVYRQSVYIASTFRIRVGFRFVI